MFRKSHLVATTDSKISKSTTTGIRSYSSWRVMITLASVACIVAGLIGWSMSSSASTPSNETLTDVSGPKTYTAGPFNIANGTPVPQLDSGPRCSGANNSASTLPYPCDNNALTVNIPAAYLTLHPNASVKVTMFWTDKGSTASDYDLYIFNGTVGATSGAQGAAFQSSSGSNPEIAVITPLTAGPQQYSIKIVPYTPSQEIVNVSIELQAGANGGGGGCTVNCGSFGGADPTVPGNPRYLNFYAPAGTSAEASQGEFNIGFNPHTGRIMTMNTGPVWRLTPPEILATAKPECCEALWQDKSSTVTDTGVDPILFTDQKSGRTFASNSTAGANAVYAYTDNDGDLWVPIGGGPPNGGADHQTIGTGPFPASLSALGNVVNQGENTLYCSQDIVGPAFCARSLDLGATWGPGVPAYTGVTTGCGGLHGHVHIAPNGTAWLPVNQCNGQQGGAVSTDAGTTWNEFIVTGSVSQTNGADPSVALDSASKAYYCYVNNEAGGTQGHVRVKTSTDGGVTWTNDFDLGASHGIVNAAHTEAIGGSAGRAACGFFGTNVSGNYQAGTFTGVWYPFIATTYDGGVTWTTVNTSPNDPIQSKTGIWQQGGSGQNGDRNLLDFNEITVDDKGRVLYGYSDGCHSAACIAGTAPSDLGAFMRVARQSGGKPLFSQFDPVEPAAPKPPCLSGTRDSAASHLTWKTPDNGGSDIAYYKVYRGLSTGTETFLADTSGPKNNYNDATADPLVAQYFYTVKAVNAMGAVIGNASNEISLTISVPPPLEFVCTLPGLTKLTDASGDTSAALGIVSTPAPPGSDLLKFQIAQPFASDGIIKLAFTISTNNGQAVQPAGSAWYVAMKIPGNDPVPAPQTGYHYRGVHMAWLGASPTFEYYTPSPNNSGGVDGRFVATGSNHPADASSSYASPFNKVIIVVKASDLGLNPGDIITGFVSAVSQSTDPGATVGAGATALYDQMPDSLSFTETYTVNNNQVCRPNTCPVAALTATPTSGNAPLLVNFSGATSSDPDTAAPADTIAFYTFDFGDGSAPVTQSTATISHTYSAAGPYTAKLTVTDSRALVSCNTAQQTITVNAVAARTNYSLTANGGTAIGSTSANISRWPASSAINGDRTGNAWGNGTGGWNDGTRGIFPDNLEVDFSGQAKAIDEIDVFTLQNNWTTAGEPTLTTPATGEGILDFDVQYWNGSAWVTVTGGSVTSNDKAWRQFTFAAVTTTKIRVVVNNSRNNYSRIVELEAYGAGGQP